MKQVAILGGGIAGLSAAYFLEQAGMSYDLFECGDTFGGLAKTHQYGDFYVDHGAHRIHDVDPEITQWFKDLLEGDLHQVNNRSAVIRGGNVLEFPLSPINLLSQLPVHQLIRYGYDWFKRPQAGEEKNLSFYDQTMARFGASLAQDLVFDYSQKLWGCSVKDLSSELGTARLKSLDFKTAIKEIFFQQKQANRHIDGSFLYPTFGFGAVTQKMTDKLHSNSLNLNTRVLSVSHITGDFFVTTNQGKGFYEKVICTLPLSLAAQIVDWVELPFSNYCSCHFKMRDVVTFFITLAQKSVSKYASLYFADPKIPLTRIHEPKNRSRFMSPEGATSLLIEVPIDFSQSIDQQELYQLQAQCIEILISNKIIKAEDIIDIYQKKIVSAYPVITTDVSAKRNRLVNKLCSLSGFYCLGRNATFRYLHVHEILKYSRDIVDSILHLNRFHNKC